MRYSSADKSHRLAIATRELDPTRLVVFASNTVSKANLKPEAEGSVHGDFVCLNTYGSTPQQNAANIDRAHALYPNKPLVVTEYGLRRNAVATVHLQRLRLCVQRG